MGTQSSWQSERSTSHNNGLVDQAKGAVSEVAEAAREQVGSQIGNQKGRIAEQISQVAQALRDTGSRLGEGDHSGIAASYVDKAAAQIERVADYVESRDISDIVGEVQGLARREPAVFFGGLFTLGLVAGRFLKSSARPSADSSGFSHGQSSWQRHPSSSQSTEGRDWSQAKDDINDRSSASRQGSYANTSTNRASSPLSGGSASASSAIPRPQQQAKPEVIPPAPIREVGTDTGSSGASAASGAGSASGTRGATSSTSTTPGVAPTREPGGGSGGGAS